MIGSEIIENKNENKSKNIIRKKSKNKVEKKRYTIEIHKIVLANCWTKLNLEKTASEVVTDTLNKFKCDDCGNCFTSYSLYRKHMKNTQQSHDRIKRLNNTLMSVQNLIKIYEPKIAQFTEDLKQIPELTRERQYWDESCKRKEIELSELKIVVKSKSSFMSKRARSRAGFDELYFKVKSEYVQGVKDIKKLRLSLLSDKGEVLKFDNKISVITNAVKNFTEYYDELIAKRD